MKYTCDNEHDTEVNITLDNEVSLEFLFCSFENRVTISNCTIEKMDFDATHFFGGLLLDDCTINCKVRWTSGGHNKKPLVIRNCTFLEFVDFEDCSFESEVILENVKFQKDTNLFGNKNTPVEVVFEHVPELKNVSGNLNIETFKTPNKD